MLIEFSNIFQRIAIGWEQVALDSDPVYGNDFTSTKTRIKNVKLTFNSEAVIILV